MACRKLRKQDYEEHLNDLYTPDEAMNIGEYLNAPKLLIKGKYGTALRKNDPVCFNLGYNEWVNQHA